LIRKVLITGGAGYLGSELVNFLLKKRFKVTVLDTFYFGFDTIKHQKNLKIIHNNIESFNFKEKYDCIIDLAAISNDPTGKYFNKSTYSINYKGRYRIAKLAKKKKIKKYILISSCSVYGNQKKICDEKTKPKPLTQYAKCNLMAERATLKLSNKNFCVTVLRLATLFGKSNRMRLDLAINNMVFQGLRESKIPLLRDGNQFRPFISIEFVSKIIHRLLLTERDKIAGEIFNIGHKNFNIQLKKLAKEIKNILIKKKLNQKVKIKFYGSKDNRNYFVDFTKISRLVKIDNLSFEKEITSLVNFFQKKNLNESQGITVDWYKNLHKWNIFLNKIKFNKNKLVK